MNESIECKCCETLAGKLVKRQRENARLREALTDALNYVEAVCFNAHPGKKRENYARCASRLRAALDAKD